MGVTLCNPMENSSDDVVVIIVKKSSLHHRCRPQECAFWVVPVEEMGVSAVSPTEQQQRLLADVMESPIGGRDDEQSVDDVSDMKEDLPHESLSDLIVPDAQEQVVPPTDDSFEPSLDRVTQRVPQRKRKVGSREVAMAESIRLEKEEETVIADGIGLDGEDEGKEEREQAVELRPIHHIKVRTRRVGKKRKKKRKLRPIDILPKLGILIAVCIFAWPVISDAYKQWAYSQAISEGYSYDWEDPKYQEILEQAHLYNQMLSGTLPDDVDVNSIWPYEKQLDYGSGGMMAWVEIPDLTLKLPIYHGSDEESLMAGVGHMERTSLPVGGDHTKCAISGHTGMHNERMFDSLDELEEDDVVIIHSMGKDLYYAVTYKEVVKPDALDKLYIDCEDSQLVLITCTPRGVNSHRLLVHATQVDEESTQVKNTNPTKAALNYLLSPTVIFLTGMLAFLLVFFLLWLFKWRKKKTMVRVEELTEFSALSTKLFGEQIDEFDEFEWESDHETGDDERKRRG